MLSYGWFVFASALTGIFVSLSTVAGGVFVGGGCFGCWLKL